MELKACIEINPEFNNVVVVPCESTQPHSKFCLHGTRIYSLDKNKACRANYNFKLQDNSVVNYLGLTDNTLSLVRVDAREEIHDFSVDGLDFRNYVLVDCVGGWCKQTQGYLIYGPEIYAFIGSNVGIDAANLVDAGITSDQLCSSSGTTNIGKVIGN